MRAAGVLREIARLTAWYLAAFGVLDLGLVVLSGALGGASGLAAGVGVAGVLLAISIPAAILAASTLIAFAHARVRSRTLPSLAAGCVSALAVWLASNALVAIAANTLPPGYAPVDSRPALLLLAGAAGVVGVVIGTVTDARSS